MKPQKDISILPHPLVLYLKGLNKTSFLSTEKFYPEERSAKGIGLFYAELFLYIWQRYVYLTMVYYDMSKS